MFSTSLSPSNREVFLRKLVEEYGVKKKRTWQNNNGTVSQKAYIINLKNIDDVAGIIAKLFEYNQNSHEPPLVAVPVAGWQAKVKNCEISSNPIEQRLVEVYAKSFSLSSFTTAVNADLILRISKKAQMMEVFEKEGKRLFRVTPGVRITDAEKFLAARKLALCPNMPTLHVASIVGAASNGSYGPGKNYMSMTTNISEMKVVSPTGKSLTLSSKENPELFSVLRDCHMGSGFFVSEITLENIEPDFLMKRTNLLLKNAEEFREVMETNNLLDRQHFILHYIPVDMNEQGEHLPRLRVTTFERTIEAPSEETKPREHQDFMDYVNLVETSAGEPLIKLITASERLRQFFPFVIQIAAKKTFGSEKETSEIDSSANIAHILRTYTEAPIADVNWLIQVKNEKKGCNLLVNLMNLVEKKLEILAQDRKYPLLTVFSRYLKGIYFPFGEGGVAPTAVDKEGYSVLSFEFVTYSPLDKTEGFKDLLKEVNEFLKENNYKFKFHPGKTWPENLYSLTQIFTDTIDQQRLSNFQNAIIKLHGERENIRYSPFLTPQKKLFIGLTEDGDEKNNMKVSKFHKKINSEQRKQALLKISELAEEHGKMEIKTKVNALL